MTDLEIDPFTIVIDETRVEKQKILFRAVMKKVREDHLVKHGDRMLKEDAIAATLLIMAKNLYSIKEES